MLLNPLPFLCHRLLGLLANVSATLPLKVRIWNALVCSVHVLLYGCGTWGLTAALTEKLRAFHQQHLRTVAGYRWSNYIDNEALYKLSSTHPLSVDLQLARLRLLGHCLRLPITSPAQAALDLSVGADADLKSRSNVILVHYDKMCRRPASACGLLLDRKSYILLPQTERDGSKQMSMCAT